MRKRSAGAAAASMSLAHLLLVLTLGLLLVALATNAGGGRGRKASKEHHKKLSEQLARKNEFPFMVFIIIWNDTLNRDNYCGGTIVDERFVLTSASCICDTKSPDSIVRLEYIKIGTGCLIDDECAHPYRIAKAIVHKKFGPGGKYDLALLKINRLIEMNGDPKKGPLVSPITFEMKPLCMGPTGQANRLMTVLGWGGGQKRRRIRELRQFAVARISKDSCKSSLPFIHWDSSICYGSAAESDACGFDSGSPLLNQLTLTSYTQIGTVSDNGLCANPQAGQPTSVIPFQDLAPHYRWIQSCIVAEADCPTCPSVVSDRWW